jgi:general secretion pathway protein D
VTINLVNVPAPQAAKIILGYTLTVKYTVDPGIEGKITIQTPKPVARSAVIDLFQAALRPTMSLSSIHEACTGSPPP